MCYLYARVNSIGMSNHQKRLCASDERVLVQLCVATPDQMIKIKLSITVTKYSSIVLKGYYLETMTGVLLKMDIITKKEHWVEIGSNI